MSYEATNPFGPPDPPPLTDREASLMGELVRGFHHASVGYLTRPGLSFSSRFHQNHVTLEVECVLDSVTTQKVVKFFQHCEARNGNKALRKIGEDCCHMAMAVITETLLPSQAGQRGHG